MEQYSDDINLKDLISKLRDYTHYLHSKKRYILMGIVFFMIIGVCGYILSDSKYDAELTFVVEGENSGGMNMGAISGIASQFGLNLGGGGEETFSQQNIIEILKSRRVISNTLMKQYLIDGKNKFLIEHYLDIHGIRDNLDEDLISLSFSGELTINHDSLINIVWDNIVDNHISIDYQTVDANIISLNYTSSNEEFAKHFVDELISQMSIMYTKHKTAQSQRTIDFINNRADSVFFELERVEKEYARIQDINQRIVKASGRLKELQLFREVEVLNTMYLELVKNLEISKLTLQNETPIINIIDRPVLPLKNTSLGLLLWMILSIILGVFFSSLFFVFKKLFTDALLEETD